MDELEFRSMKKYYEAYGYEVIEIRKITNDISEYMATNRWDCLNHRFYENKKEHLFLGVPEDNIEWVIKYANLLKKYKPINCYSWKRRYELKKHKVEKVCDITQNIVKYSYKSHYHYYYFYEDITQHIGLGFVNDTEDYYIIKYNKALVSYKEYLEKEKLKKCTNNQVIKKDADLVAKHKEICEKLNKIYEKKNHDYGDSFGETYNELGIISCVTRMNDKMNRLKTLAKTDNQVKDESISDTLLDLANYAIMTYMCLQKGDEEDDINAD